MRKFIISITCLLFVPMLLISQELEFHDSLKDTIEMNGEFDPPVDYTQPINLSGSVKLMVIVIGFPDRNNDWPTIKNNNQYYPILGAFPDGTLLSEYIDTNGPLQFDSWYEAAVEKYFQVHSGGLYNVDAIFPKPGNGKTYITDHALQYWITQNNGSNNVCWEKYEEMINEVSIKILLNNPDAFNDINLVQITFAGISKNEFHTNHAGLAINNLKIRNPNNPAEIYYNGPAGLLRDGKAIIHETLHVIGKMVGTPNNFKGLPDRGEEGYLGYNFVPQDPNLPNSIHWNLTTNFDIMWHSHGQNNQHSLYNSAPMLSHDLIFLGWINHNEIFELNIQNMADIKLASITYPLTESQLAEGFVRILKVMINENFSQDLDEYFLIE